MTILIPAIEELVDRLRNQILGGELKPCTPLNQNELAATFNLNRSQVREALSVLSEERMVLMRAYATAVVAPLSLSEFEELHEIRMALEPLLSQMALPTLPRHHLLKMRELNELMQGSDDGETWLNANDEFHALLYRETDRPWMVEIVDRARRLTSRYTSILVVKMGSRQGELEHVGIMEAIEGQDTRELGRRLSAHMESGYDLVIKHLARHPELLGSQPDGCGGKTR